MSTSPKPLILTAGDPSGVGPEITVKAWKEIGHKLPFAVLGDIEQFERLAQAVNIKLKQVDHPGSIVSTSLCVIPQAFHEPPRAGEHQPQNAPGTVEMIKRAVAFVKDEAASAIVTNPIHKKVLVDGASFPYPGHTEFLADLDNKPHSVMMLSAPDLKVVPVTIHIALKEVPAQLDEALLLRTIRTLNEALKRDFSIKNPRIAVAGLNPHAGEGGQMGQEELDMIGPTLDQLRAEGIDLRGPLSADTMFHANARQTYHAAVCMYHDQALIPIKTIDFDRGVNTTLGLSFIRTSPDHGTAYDIAGKGIANPSSLIEAIKMAAFMAQNRGKI